MKSPPNSLDSTTKHSLKILMIAYAATMTVCALVQLAIGGSASLVFTLYAISLTGLFPLTQRQITLPGLIYLSITLYSGSFALLMKTVLFQPVQQNLQVPALSALILLIGHAAVTAAWAISAAFPLRIRALSTLKAHFDAPDTLRFFSRVGFALGYGASILHIILRPQLVNGVSAATEGFGGFGSFYFLLVFGFAAQAALCSVSRSRREFLIAAVMFLLIAALSIMANVKKDMLDAALVIALTIIAFNLRVRPTLFITAVIFFVFFQLIMSPLIHITRAQSHSGGITERLSISREIIRQNNYDLGRINEINDNISRGFRRSFRSSGSYVYPSTLNIDRFSLILPVDQVARVGEPGRVSFADTVGLVAQRVLPSALISKTQGTLADHVAWSYGFRLHGNVARPVVGLSASAYALWGMFGVAALSFAAMISLFWFLGAIGGSLTRSAWTVGFATYLSFLAEKEVDAIAGAMLRDIPLALISVSLILVIRRFFALPVRPVLHPNPADRRQR